MTDRLPAAFLSISNDSHDHTRTSLCTLTNGSTSVFVRAEHWFVRGYWIALPCRVQMTQSTRGHLGVRKPSSNQFTCD